MFALNHPFSIPKWFRVSRLEESARATGAVNVVVMEAAGPGDAARPRLVGHNTDCLGVQAALGEAGVGRAAAAGVVVALLGAGGVARAIIAALAALGAAEVRVFDPDAARAAELAADFGAGGRAFRVTAVASAAAAVEGAAGVVNASPVGMVGFPTQRHEAAEARLAAAPPRWVADMVYSPAETQLVAAARRSGCLVATGDRVLLHQGAAAFELLNPGLRADVAAMEAALRGLLAGSGGSVGAAAPVAAPTSWPPGGLRVILLLLIGTTY